MTGGEAFAEQLSREGVKAVFGIPGVQLDWAMDGLAKLGSRIDFYSPRHEQTTAYMADGYARSTGEIGVCMVVPGPGMLNAMAALATAYSCSSPVLCVSGQIPSHAIGRGWGMLHEVRDQSKTLSTVTKWNGIALSAREVPALVHEAFVHLRSGRPQPVGIEIPPDVLQAQVDVELVPPHQGIRRLEPDAAQLEQAAQWLRGAERPVIYAGWGVQAAGAWDELKALAEALQAPVVHSERGRGALSDRHPLALTSLGGRIVVPRADVVLVVGSRFLNGIGKPCYANRGTKFIFLNADARDFTPPRNPDLAILGDAKTGLAALAELVGKAHRASRANEVAKVRLWCELQTAGIEPQYGYVRSLRAAIPEDGILVTELTQVSYLAQLAYPVYGPRTFLTPGYQGTLGYGFGTGLGVAVGNPDRAVVAITGDGGFGWNLQELATARKYNLNLVTVVFSDNAFGNVRRTQKQSFGGRVLGTDLVNPDFVKLADAFGVQGIRAEGADALQSALRSAIASRRPALIEVPVGEMNGAWHLIHDFRPAPGPVPADPLG